MKKQDEIKQEPEEQIEIVKEDCYVQVDNSSYGDWLLTQGIDLSMSPPGAAPIVISPETSDAEKQALPIEKTSKEKYTQNIEVVQDKVDDGNNLQKPEIEKDKDILPDHSEDGAQGQSLTEPNFLLQMQSLISSGATEEESIDRIKKLKTILDIMESKHQGCPPVQVNKNLAVNILKKQEETVPKENIEPDISQSKDDVVIPEDSKMVDQGV